LTVALAASCLLAIVTGVPLSAQEQFSEAVLLSGPTAIKGIPVYTPNRAPAFRGEYSLEGEQGATKQRILRVLYTRQDLLIPQTWSSRRCGVWRFYQVPDSETFTLCYRDDQGFLLFFIFPEVEEPAYWCSFTNPFIERFLFLFNFIESETDVPFPAILQVG
jgi:hypothetical protein